MQRSKHNLSHHRITTMNQGDLVPIGCVEVLPGDSFRHSTSCLVRVGALDRPVMHPVHVRVHHWFVPNRLTWTDWDDFITGTNTALSVPTVALTNANAPSKSLGDMLGCRIGTGGSGVTANALPFRAYNAIWNDNYRDQDLDAVVATDNLVMKKVRWEKDYFTTARTAGGAAVGASVPVYGIGKETGVFSGSQAVRDSRQQSVVYPFSRVIDPAVVDSRFHVEGTAATNAWPSIRTDITLLRQGLAVQKFMERRARFGHRFSDYLRYLGVKPSDGRLDTPEYLGGGVQTIAFSEVLATSEGTNTVPGDMFGHGIAGMRTRPYKRFFEEHGYILSLMSVRPKSVYYGIVPRHWLRSKHLDFWQKEFEVMGPQAILSKEISDNGAASGVFGYAGRNDEYRQLMSTIHGEFTTSSHDNWHFGRSFTAATQLNTSFIECIPTDLPFSDQTEDELYCMINHRITARRLLRAQAMGGLGTI